MFLRKPKDMSVVTNSEQLKNIPNCRNPNFDEHGQGGSDCVNVFPHLKSKILNIPLHGGISELT